MTAPSPTATKSDWRAWARTLDPVPDDVARAANDHVRGIVHSAGGVVLGYEALPDEVELHVPIDAVAKLDAEGDLLLDAADGPVDAFEVALVLVPGRVFDRAGYRLGRGGGHYDRLLPQLRLGTPVIGVTCTARIVEQLPREAHDLPMTHLVTEDGIDAL